MSFRIFTNKFSEFHKNGSGVEKTQIVVTVFFIMFESGAFLTNAIWMLLIAIMHVMNNFLQENVL